MHVLDAVGVDGHAVAGVFVTRRSTGRGGMADRAPRVQRSSPGSSRRPGGYGKRIACAERNEYCHRQQLGKDMNTPLPEQ
jgi:hypothetical protein